MPRAKMDGHLAREFKGKVVHSALHENSLAGEEEMLLNILESTIIDIFGRTVYK
jgi:hypothetical protein